MDSCFDLVGSRQHGVAARSNQLIARFLLNNMLMTSDETSNCLRIGYNNNMIIIDLCTVLDFVQ